MRAADTAENHTAHPPAKLLLLTVWGCVRAFCGQLRARTRKSGVKLQMDLIFGCCCKQYQWSVDEFIGVRGKKVCGRMSLKWTHKKWTDWRLARSKRSPPNFCCHWCKQNRFKDICWQNLLDNKSDVKTLFTLNLMASLFNLHILKSHGGYCASLDLLSVTDIRDPPACAAINGKMAQISNPTPAPQKKRRKSVKRVKICCLFSDSGVNVLISTRAEMC